MNLEQLRDITAYEAQFIAAFLDGNGISDREAEQIKKMIGEYRRKR